MFGIIVIYFLLFSLNDIVIGYDICRYYDFCELCENDKDLRVVSLLFYLLWFGFY